MARSPAARRYARALFELARERGVVELVMADLSQIAHLCERREDYGELIGHHRLPVGVRENIWREILEKEADPLTLRFIRFLLFKKRTDILGDIIEHFNAIFHDVMGVLPLDITSARPLDDAQVEDISHRFRERFGKRRVKAFLHVDPGLLGGFQVRIEDVVYDYSIRHKLELLHRKLTTA